MTTRTVRADAQPRHSRVVRADELSERHMGRWVRVGDITGTLTGLLPVADQVTLALVVGTCRAWLPVEAGAHVEHWKKDA